MKEFQEYLSLLDGITTVLEQLTETAQQKSAAVRQDDLAALNETLKQEQALALALRGYEQKRASLLAVLNLRDVSLNALPNQAPPALRLTAKETAEKLRRHYQLYGSAAEAARSLLETNLHQIEKVLAQEDSPAGPGYLQQPPSVQPPPSLRSDFRA